MATIKKVAEKNLSATAKKPLPTKKEEPKKVEKKLDANKGIKPSAKIKEGGKEKSYSQIAREILEKTSDRAKATAKLKELQCPSAAAIVAKMAQKLGIEGSGASIPKKKVTVKPKMVEEKKTKAPATKTTKKAKKELPEEDLEEEFLEDDFEDDDF